MSQSFRNCTSHSDRIIGKINKNKRFSFWNNKLTSSITQQHTKTYSTLRFSFSVSTAIFPGGSGQAGTRMSPFWILLEIRVMEVVVTTGAVRRVQLQSIHYHQQTNIQHFTDHMPFLSPNNVKALMGWYSIVRLLFLFLLLLQLHLFNSQCSRLIRISRYQKIKLFSISLQQEMINMAPVTIGIIKHIQITCIQLQCQHTNISAFSE